MSFDKFLLAVESCDLSQADKSIIRVSSFPKLFLNDKIYSYTKNDALVNFITHKLKFWKIEKKKFVSVSLRGLRGNLKKKFGAFINIDR